VALYKSLRTVAAHRATSCAATTRPALWVHGVWRPTAPGRCTRWRRWRRACTAPARAGAAAPVSTRQGTFRMAPLVAASLWTASAPRPPWGRPGSNCPGRGARRGGRAGPDAAPGTPPSLGSGTAGEPHRRHSAPPRGQVSRVVGAPRRRSRGTPR
jgi:hypothetical protein